MNLHLNPRGERVWSNGFKLGLGVSLNATYARDGYGGNEELEATEWSLGPQLSLGYVSTKLELDFFGSFEFGSAGNSIQGKDNLGRLLLGAELSWNIVERLRLRGSFRHLRDVVKIGTPQTPRDNSDTELGLSLEYRFSSTFGVQAGYSHILHQGDANSANADLLGLKGVFSW
jgi:hypothetical protein